MRQNNPNIIITNHARERLFERFINPAFLHATDEAKRNEYADQVILEMFADSVYVSDENGTILFRAIDYKAELLVSNNAIITLFNVGEKKVEDKRSKTQQGIQARAHKRLEENAAVIGQFSYTVVAGTLTRLVTDLVVTPEEFNKLVEKMERAEKELQNG